jgi:predicted PurR-regulated permease PerM
MITVQNILFLGSAYMLLPIIKEVSIFLICAVIMAYILSPLTKTFNYFLSKLFSNHVSWNLSCITSVIFFSYTVYISINFGVPVIQKQVTQFCNLISNDDILGDLVKNLDASISVKELIINTIAFIKSKIASSAEWIIGKFSYLSKLVLHDLFKILLVLIVSFHILREWYKWPFRFLNMSNNSILSQYRNNIRIFIILFNNGMQNWIKGQLLVSFILSLYYGACFYLLDINASIILGIVFGLSSFVPYIGDIVTYICIGLAMCYSSITVFKFILAISFILLGHSLGSHLLTPLFVGMHTGIHPIQIILGLLVYSKLFGVIGVILNIPLSIIINSIIKSFTDERV